MYRLYETRERATLGLTLPDAAQPSERELKRIVRDLPPQVELWTGGAGTAAYESLIAARGPVFSDLDAYAAQLSRVGARLD